MVLEKIEHGLATVVLDAEECETLSHACAAAVGVIIGAEQERLRDSIETYGAAFAAAAAAGYMQEFAVPGDSQELEERLRSMWAALHV